MVRPLDVGMIEMEPLYRSVTDRFSELSASDKSCLVAMLKTPNAVQLTSRNSAHDAFYTALESLGWSEQTPFGEDLAELCSFAVQWVLTSSGRTELPYLLAEYIASRSLH